MGFPLWYFGWKYSWWKRGHVDDGDTRVGGARNGKGREGVETLEYLRRRGFSGSLEYVVRGSMFFVRTGYTMMFSIRVESVEGRHY